MKYTGERLTTDVGNTYGTNEHLSRYAFAKQFVYNKIVLDIACGEGYGTNLLSNGAKHITGIDIDIISINHAKSKYKSKNITFLQGCLTKIPIANESIDVIISFESIEHIIDQEKALSEFKRILKKDGQLIISSPSKEIYQTRDPYNKYHLKELTDNEFSSLIESYFKYIYRFRQSFVCGTLINGIERNQGVFSTLYGDFKNIHKGFGDNHIFFNKKFFNIILSSDSQITEPPVAIFFDGVKSLENDILRKIEGYKESFRARTIDFFMYPLFILKKIIKLVFG